MKPFNMARRGAIAAALGVALCALPQFAAAQAPAAPAAPAASGKTEILWLGQAATRIKTPGGKVIVIDPWLRRRWSTGPPSPRPEPSGPGARPVNGRTHSGSLLRFV